MKILESSENKSPRPLRAAVDRERFLITNKHTEILDCIQTVQKLERKQTDKQTNRQTDGRTDGRDQTYYLPGFAVDNEHTSYEVPYKIS